MADPALPHPSEPEPDLDPRTDSAMEESRMPFLEHLRELRQRIRNAGIAVAVGILIAYQFQNELFTLLAQPLIRAWRAAAESNPAVGAPDLRFGSLIEPFWTLFSVSMWAGIFVASPFIFHQIWKFIAPGLYRHERRYGVAFGVFSGVFFLTGAAFCYFLVLEPIFTFLIGYANPDLAKVSHGLGVEYQVGESLPISPTLFMGQYLDFSKKLLLGFGLVFELPLLVFFLSITGMVTHRSMWKFNRWAIILAVVLAALLTPPDVYSQVFLAGPIIVLYNLSIIVSFFVTIRRERKQASYEQPGPP